MDISEEGNSKSVVGEDLDHLTVSEEKIDTALIIHDNKITTSTSRSASKKDRPVNQFWREEDFSIAKKLRLSKKVHSDDAEPREHTSQGYKKRAGTVDLGKEYEDYVAAYLALKLSIDEEVHEFEISVNDANFGTFDDVVVKVVANDNVENYAIQLKHSKERKYLPLESLRHRTGNFSIWKYMRSYEDIFLKNYNKENKVILSTNCLSHLKDGNHFDLGKISGQVAKLKVVKLTPKQRLLTFPETQIFKFQISEEGFGKSEEFFQNFFLYCNQPNIHQIKENIENMFREQFTDCSALPAYINFIKEWSKRERMVEKLTKRMIKQILCLQLLTPHVHPFLNGNKVTNETRILQNAISNFDITVINVELSDVMAGFWRNEELNLNENKDIIKKYQLAVRYDGVFMFLNELEHTKLYWLKDICPLIVDANDFVLRIIRFVTFKKFILLTKSVVSNDKLQHGCRIFRNLNDLRTLEHIFHELITTFACKVHKTMITLKDLIASNEQFLTFITTFDLAKMINGPYIIDYEDEDISEPYIHRYITLNIISFKYLEHVEKDVFILIDCFNLKEDEVKVLQNFSVTYIKSDLDVFFGGSNTEDSGSKSSLNNQLYVCTRRCLPEEFRKIVYKNPGKKVYHHFRLTTGNNLEWIRTNSNVDDLENFRTHDFQSVCETEFYNNETGNNINLITGDSGMGKSELLKNLKNNYSVKPVSIILYPEDVKELCLCLGTDDCLFYVDKFVKSIIHVKFKEDSDLTKQILEMLMKEGKVAFFWDAVDELSSETLEFVIEIILKLSEFCIHWITCRTHLKRHLQRRLKVLARNITHFDDTQQEDYIRRRLPDLPEELISKIKSTLKLIKREEILGTPLQIFMLTELFRQNYEANLDGNVMSLTDLYKCFLKEKFNLFFKEKAKISSENPFAGDILQTYENTVSENYEKAALQVLAPDVLQWFKTSCEKFLEKIAEEKDSVGIITRVINSTPHFIHISYAEYFVASYFLKHHMLMKNSFKTFLFKPERNNIRFFFDTLLAANSPLHRAILYRDSDFVRTFEEINESVDDGGRNALHLACSWGQRYPHLEVRKEEDNTFIIDDANDTVDTPESEEYLNTLMYLLEHCNTTQTDELFNYTPINYAEEANCLFVKFKIIQKENRNLFMSTSNIESSLEDAKIMYYSAKFGFDEAIDICDEVPFIRTEKDSLSILHLTVKNHHENFLRKLLAFDIYRNRINETNDMGETLLYKTCEYGHHIFIPLLIGQGADPAFTREGGWSVLHVACFKGHLQVVKSLTEHDCDVNLSANDGVTPLHLACLNKHFGIAQHLLDHRANPNISDQNGWTSFHVACQEGDEEIVQLLLTSGAQVNFTANNGWTSLHKTCQKGHLEIVKLLIENGVGINDPANDGKTPLHVACLGGQTSIVRFLTELEETDLEAVDEQGCKPLYTACQNGNFDVVDILIKKETSINFKTSNGRTYLHAACENGHKDIVEKLLLMSNIEINIYDDQNLTPLHLACQQGNCQIVDLLVKKGATIRVPENNIWSPLHSACRYGHVEVVRYLINYDRTLIDISDSDGLTLLHVACKEGHYDIVGLLINEGARIDSTDNKGYSPLHFACENGYSRIVQLLLSNDADLAIRASNGKVPIMLASANNHRDVLKTINDFRNQRAMQKI